MKSFDYQNTYNTFVSIVKLAGNWTTDYRGLARNSNSVYDALYKLLNWEAKPHHVKMTASQQRNIVGCLKTVSWAAGKALDKQGEGGHHNLTIQTGEVLTALNLLFEQEGLEPITEL